MEQAPTIGEIREEIEKLRELKVDIEYNVHPKTGLELLDVNRSFDEQVINGNMDPVIGNEDIRTLAVILYGLRHKSICITGVAGSAKTTTTRGIINLLFGDQGLNDESAELLVYSGGSDKAFLNEDTVARLEDTTHLYIEELQNVFRGAGGGDSVMEDIFKTMTTGDTFHYTRTTGGGHGSETMAIKPMAILTTRANENQRFNDKKGFNEEYERRFISLYTRSDKIMNSKVHLRKALNEAVPDGFIKITSGKKRSLLRKHLFDVRMKDYDNIRGKRLGLNVSVDTETYVPPAKIKNIMAPFVEHVIPKEFTISNTLIGYWHEAIKGITAFYYKDRMQVEKGNKTYLLSTPADVYMAWVLFGESLINQCFSIKDIGRKVLSILPVRSVSDEMMNLNDVAPVSVDYIRDALLNDGMNRSSGQIEQIIATLMMAGYAKMEKSSTGKILYYKSKDYDSEFEVGVNWPTVIDNVETLIRDLYPEVADEYIERYCKVPLCVHPLKGEVVNLRDITVREVAIQTKAGKANRKKDLKPAEDEDYSSLFA